MKFDRLRWKYVLVISVMINIFLIISIINRAVPPQWKNIFCDKQYAAFKPDNYYKNRVDTYKILKNSYENKEKIMFIGDSITDGCEWHELFANDEVNIVNRGINSDRLEGLLGRLDILIEEKPKKIILMIGINNLQHGEETDHILSKYDQLLQKIFRELPRTRVAILSILPVSNEIAKSTQIKSNNAIYALNHQIKFLADKYKFDYIDIFGDFEKNGHLNEMYSYDGLHPNGQGYLIIKNRVSFFITG